MTSISACYTVTVLHILFIVKWQLQAHLLMYNTRIQ